MEKAVKGTSEDIISLYRDLENVRMAHLVKAGVPNLAAEQIKEHLEQKIPLMSFTGLEIDGQEAITVFNEVFEILLKYSQGEKDDANRVREILSSDLNLTKLLKNVIWQEAEVLEEFFAKNDLNSEFSLLLLFHTARPFVANLASGLKERLQPELWYDNKCPVCGWSPDFAYEADKSGQRNLHCPMCDTKWLFKNLMCPSCLNEDHKSLSYFNVENDEVFRVYVCEKCKGYIKTVREGRTIRQEASTILEAQTMHLDVLANREGYTKEVSFEEDKVN